MLSRVHLILDGGPNETVKDNVIAMLGSASLDESMESVMVESLWDQLHNEIISKINSLGKYFINRSYNNY